MSRLVGYGKLGRSMPLTLEKCGNLGGDVEMVAVVKELALRHPEDNFILIGRNSGEASVDIGLPDNIINPWYHWRDELRQRFADAGIKGNLSVEEHQVVLQIFRNMMGNIWRELDSLVLWVGQHGSSNMAIPKIQDRSILTKPQDWCAFYAGYMLDGVNQFREGREETHDVVWLNADTRNKHKMRDLKHPLRNPVLTQYAFVNSLKHERYDGSPPLSDTVRNVYARLEVNGLAPGTPFGDLITWNDTWDRPYEFGMFINEARALGVKKGMDRLSIMKEWVLPLSPDWLHGTWSDASMHEIAQTSWDRDIRPAPWNQYYSMLNKTRCTFTTPSSGSGWATAKPWEAFAGGTVCFFHPAYDDQNHILQDAHPSLQKWLRVETPKQLRDRVRAVNDNPTTFAWLIEAQRAHFDNAMREKRYLTLIEEMM